MDKRKQWFFLFLVVMAVCGMASRVLASFTTPLVVMGNVQSKKLQYEVTGEGRIEASVKEYLPCLGGIRIERIYKRAGQKVKKGDIILKYRLEEIEKQIVTLKKELKQQEIAMEQEEVAGKENPEDQIIDTLSLDSSKRSIQQLDKQLKQLEKEEQLLLANRTEALIKEKKKEYNTASYALEQEKLNQKEILVKQEEEIQDAEEAMEEQREWEQELKTLVAGYLASENQNTERQTYIKQIYALGYGTEKEWEAHEKEIQSANLVSIQAQNVLQMAQNAYKNAVIKEETDVSSYEMAVVNAQNEVQQAMAKLIELQEKENEIQNKLKQYEEATKKDSVEQTRLYEQLKIAIYGKEELERKEKEREKAMTVIKRLKEEKERANQKANLVMEEKEKTVDEIETIIKQLENGTYSFQDVKEEIKNKKDSLKKEREAKKLEYRQLQAEQKKKEYEKEKTKKGEQLKKESMKLDYQEKKAELKEYENIKKANGYVRASQNGTITAITVEEGKKASEDDNISIGLQGFTAVIMVDAKKADYLKVGETVELSKKGETKKISAKISSIQYAVEMENQGDGSENQKTEQVEVRFLMPKGDYIEGQSISMDYIKETKVFDTCIPLQALHQDDKGYFVLILQERQTVLGTEQEAVRLGVQVIEKDENTAVLDSSFDVTTPILVSSTKMVKEGDRVRVEE